MSEEERKKRENVELRIEKWEVSNGWPAQFINWWGKPHPTILLKAGSNRKNKKYFQAVEK